MSVVFTQLPQTPNHFPLPRHWTRDRDFGPATATLDPRPRHWTRDRDIGPATATLDPRPRHWTRDRDFGPATRDPRLLVKLNWKKPYDKHLISLVFSVRTVNYGSSFFSIDLWPARFAPGP